MKALRYYSLLSILALSLSLQLPVCFAAQPKDSAKSAPSTSGNETIPAPSRDRGDRGFYGEDIGPEITAPSQVTIMKVDPKKHVTPSHPAKKAAAPGQVTIRRPAKAVKVTASTKPAVKAPRPAARANTNTASMPVAESSTIIPVAHKTTTTDSGVVVTAWLNKSGSQPKYRVGEKMQVNVTASSDCNIVVFDFDGHGKLIQIFPNDYQQSGYVKAGESITIGGPDSPFDYEIAGKGGAEKIFVYAYPVASSSPLTIAFAPIPRTPFRAAEMSIEQYKDLVNKSKVFFSREVKVVPKSGVKLASAPSAPTAGVAPNKVELSFVVEAR